MNEYLFKKQLNSLKYRFLDKNNYEPAIHHISSEQIIPEVKKKFRNYLRTEAIYLMKHGQVKTLDTILNTLKEFTTTYNSKDKKEESTTFTYLTKALSQYVTMGKHTHLVKSSTEAIKQLFSINIDEEEIYIKRTTFLANTITHISKQLKDNNFVDDMNLETKEKYLDALRNYYIEFKKVKQNYKIPELDNQKFLELTLHLSKRLIEDEMTDHMFSTYSIIENETKLN